MSSIHEKQKVGRQVLVVDDDESIRSLLRFYFEQEGYVVETAADGESALERFDAGGIHLSRDSWAKPY